MAVADFSSRMGNLSGVTEKERSSPLRQAPQKRMIFISDGFARNDRAGHALPSYKYNILYNHKDRDAKCLQRIGAAVRPGKEPTDAASR